MKYKKNLEFIQDALNNIDVNVYNTLLYNMVKTIKNKKKIIISALGKNTPIAEKIVGTMISLSFPAYFLNHNSAIHGDLGIVQRGDLVILLSKSGNTSETLLLLKYLKLRNVVIWGLTCNKDSRLYHECHNCLVAPLTYEGDKWNLVPNNSSVVFLLILQSLVMDLVDIFNVSLDTFKRNHPGGAIGEFLRKK